MPPPAAASPPPSLELTVSLVAPDAAASVLRTVQRARLKPMGRFRKWTIEHTNTRCDVVKAMRVQGGATSDGAAAIAPGTTFVLDLVGQRMGRLYRARSAASARDVLADADAVYEVHDIRRVDAAAATTQYVLRVAPFKATTAPTAVGPRGSSSARSAATLRPVWGSSLTVFFETQDRLDGRVVWSAADHVDVQVEDARDAKVWLRLTPAATGSQADAMQRPTVVEYRLDRADTPAGIATWRASRRPMALDVDRLRFRAHARSDSADAEDARALRHHLARAAPHGFGHVVLLQATSDPATVGRVRKDSVEAVHVAQAEGVPTATLERAARVDRAMPKTFPWSPTQHLDAVLDRQRKGAATSTSTLDVPLHVQPAAAAYRSWLQRPADAGQAQREADRFHVLLPSAYDLRTQPLQSCAQVDLDTVYLHITGPDARRMVEYVVGDATLGRGLDVQSVDEAGALSRRRGSSSSTRDHTSVRVKTNAHTSRRLRALLLGQALVTLVDKTGKAERAVQSRGQREAQLRHGDRALVHHWSYLGGHWRYGPTATAGDAAEAQVWTPSAFHTPVARGADADGDARAGDHDDRPLPLLHQTAAPLGHRRTTAHLFQLAPETYWPPQDAHRDYETQGQCLRTIRSEPYARILHKQVGKQMAGTGFKALMDIQELRNPGWCNVDTAGEADLVQALHAFTHGATTTATTDPAYLALAPHVQALTCDGDGHIGARYYARCADAAASDADPRAVCRALTTRDALAAIVQAHPSTSLHRYGHDTDTASQLPPLSHILYGTHDRPHRSVREVFQRKPTLSRRVVDGYATRGLAVAGVYSHSRWVRCDSGTPTTRPGVGTAPWRITVPDATPTTARTQTVALHETAASTRATATPTVYRVPTLCAAWTHRLHKAYPAAGFVVRYTPATSELTVSARGPFVVESGMAAWGVADGTQAHQDAAVVDSGARYTVRASCAALCGCGPYALRTRPTRLEPGRACTVRLRYEVAADRASSHDDTSAGGNATAAVGASPVPVVATCAPSEGVEPFEPPHDARFLTRAGRHNGQSRYTSVPVAGHPRYIGLVAGDDTQHRLLVVVRCHEAAVVDASSGTLVHRASLDWSAASAAQLSAPTVIDVEACVVGGATLRPTSWRVVHRLSGEVRAVKVVASDRQHPRVVVTSPSTDTDNKEEPSGLTLPASSSTLCRARQATLRGEVVHEVRTCVTDATGAHGVEVWRMVRTQDTTVPTLVQRILLDTAALAAAFVHDDASRTGFVLVAEAGARLSLHALSASDDDAPPAAVTHHPWLKRFPCAFPRSATAVAHARVVAVAAAPAAAEGDALQVVLGCDGRADVYTMTLSSTGAGTGARARPTRVRTCLTGKELLASAWWWRPHVRTTGGHAAVTVTLRAPKPAASVTVHDCRLGVGVADQLETALVRWLGAPLDTLDVHYAFPDETLPAGSALMQYVLRTVVGHARTTPSATLVRYLRDTGEGVARPLVVDPRVPLRAYYDAQPHVVRGDDDIAQDPLQHLPREAMRATQAVATAYHTAVAAAVRTDAPPDSRTASRASSTATTATTATPPEAKRAVFYAKVHRLLQDSGEGIPYVQRVYKRSAHFRTQFHDCKGFCYQRLLCKCRELCRGEGYGTRVRWTDAHRDATTFVADGEAYHLCRTCGERVCPQDAGLTKDYDAMGMSSTHSEHAHDQRLDDDAMAAATDADADNARQDWALASHAPIERLLRRLGLLAHRPKLDALLVSDAVFKLLPGGKGAAPRAVKAPGCTLQTAQRLLDAKAAASLVTVYACAADALLLAMGRRNVLGSRAPPVPRSTAKERAVVAAFEPQFAFAAEELQSGIAPRPYYRPHLTPRVNVNVTPKGAHGWPRLDAIVNRLDTQRPALLDPSSLDVGPTVFAQRDQYLCAPQDLHQDSRTPYTTLARLLDPTIRPRAGDTATVPARLEFVRIHPWTRLCNALAPNAHTVLPVSNPRPNAPAAHAMTAATMPKHPLAWRLHAPPTDAQRREAVAKRLLRYADATHGRFAYPLQVLLDTDLVKRHDPTALLKWLVGVTSATRYRITAHPPTDFRMKPAWMQYYEQMEPDNKVAEELVKGLCCRVVGGG